MTKLLGARLWKQDRVQVRRSKYRGCLLVVWPDGHEEHRTIRDVRFWTSPVDDVPSPDKDPALSYDEAMARS